MKIKTVTILGLLMSIQSFATTREVLFDKETYEDGAVAFRDVRIQLAGKIFFLSTYWDENGIDKNYNPDSFCSSQGYRKSISILNEVDYSGRPLTFSTYGKIDDSSINLHPKDNSYRFKTVYCANELKPTLHYER